MHIGLTPTIFAVMLSVTTSSYPFAILVDPKVYFLQPSNLRGGSQMIFQLALALRNREFDFDPIAWFRSDQRIDTRWFFLNNCPKLFTEFGN